MRRSSKDAAEERRAVEHVPSPPSDPERRLIQQRYRDAFNEALRDAVDALDAEHREILRLHFVERRTLEQLAASLGVHRATVARRLKAAREAVLGQARRAIEARLDVHDAELDSLAGLMRSQLDPSLLRLL